MHAASALQIFEIGKIVLTASLLGFASASIMLSTFKRRRLLKALQNIREK